MSSTDPCQLLSGTERLMAPLDTLRQRQQELANRLTQVQKQAAQPPAMKTPPSPAPTAQALHAKFTEQLQGAGEVFSAGLDYQAKQAEAQRAEAEAKAKAFSYQVQDFNNRGTLRLTVVGPPGRRSCPTIWPLGAPSSGSAVGGMAVPERSTMVTDQMRRSWMAFTVSAGSG
jgi:hypothetical protein